MRATQARRGSPDRSRVGLARGIDRRSAARNQVRAQQGHVFSRLIVPSWGTSTRPSEPLSGDIAFNSDSGEHEGWNGTAWDALGGGLDAAAVPVSGTSHFIHTHSRGEKPTVTVLDSLGSEVEVAVAHHDDNTVSIFFEGALTGTMILS